MITFLGTSGSAPTVDRNLPSIALKFNRDLILFDCGEGTQRQLMKYKVGFGSITAIFITHSHLDHHLGLNGLIETLNLNKRTTPLHIYVPEPVYVKEYPFVVRHSLDEIYEGDNFSVKSFKVDHDGGHGFVFQEKSRIKFYEEKAKSLGIKGSLFRTIQEQGEITINNRLIKLEEVSWIKEGKKLVYTGDCFSDDAVINAAKDADLLIHDSTFSTEYEKEAYLRKHSTAKMAAETAKKANVKQLILTHISPRISDVSVLEKEAKAIFPNTIVAFDGLRLSF